MEGDFLYIDSSWKFTNNDKQRMINKPTTEK